MIKAAVFDFDGTLVDSVAVKRQGFFEIFCGFPEATPFIEDWMARNEGTRYEIIAGVLNSLESTAGIIFKTGEKEQVFQQMVAAYSRYCDEGILNGPEIKGASAALETLNRREILCFVNSATPTGALKRIIELRGLSRWFTGVYGASASKHENLQTIQDQWLIESPRQMVMVGDGGNDQAAARSFGCAFVGIAHPEAWFDRPAEHELPDLTGFIPLLERL